MIQVRPCVECVCAFVSDYAGVYSLIQVRPCVVSVCAFVSDYASVYSLIQVRPCVVSVCVPLLVIMLVFTHPRMITLKYSRNLSRYSYEKNSVNQQLAATYCFLN